MDKSTKDYKQTGNNIRIISIFCVWVMEMLDEYCHQNNLVAHNVCTSLDAFICHRDVFNYNVNYK